ncbi:MAG: sigma-70 family RNA polymerase sigma factor [Clostridia bacterium]|nr:sigma-70 family RNA polymerase sigma factor [Clostridia bacterium]
MNRTHVSILSDDEIIALYWERNENAIKHTDVKYRSYLLKVANNILRDLQDSEECLNDTYLATWNAIPPERPYLLKAFLASIMRNQALMVCRKQNAQKRGGHCQAVSLSDLQDVLADCHETELTYELAMIIDDYLSSLDKEQRYIFIGRYYFGKQIEEIADELGVSRSKINKQIVFIKQSLREKLAKEGILL